MKDVCAVKLGYRDNAMNFDEKHSPNVLKCSSRALYLNKFYQV